MEFFTFSKISPTTTKIVDITNTARYLVEGSKEALLIDTCTGAGDLKKAVESLTDLPVTVVLTHGHVDHLGGAARFDKVYMSHKDLFMLPDNDVLWQKKNFTEFSNPRAKELTDRDYCPTRTDEFLPLYDGMEFDLGGITIKAVAVPGHTPGMMCMLCKEERWILFGDACNTAVFLFGDEALTVEEYIENLSVLENVRDEYDTIILSHMPWTAKKTIVREVKELRQDIMDGKNDPEEFIFPVLPYTDLLRGAKVNPQMQRLDGKEGNIIYRQQKIFKK